MPYTNSSGVYLSNPEGGNYEGYDGEGGVYQSGITGGAYEDQQSSQEYSSVTRAEQAALDALAAKVAAEAAQAVAELAETNAQIAEANAELAEANAEQAEGNAEAAQAAAEAARNLALAYRDAALVAKTAAEAARDLANTYATNAANSATTATTQAGIAVTQAGIAATQATNAAASASSAAATLLAIEQVFDDFDDIYLGAKASDPTVDNDGDPLVAGQIYWNTTEQEVRFYNGTAWERPEYSASQSALAALASANAASASAISASSSAANAATSASTATTQAGIATTQASNAATSATNASNSATAAATSATNAANSATSASTSATNAASSATAAAASYDSFDDRYLGVKASAPSVDNDGAALLNGALYFDSTLNIMRVYSTTGGWQSITNALASEPVRHSVRPSLLLDFANTKTLDPRITFTRGSTGTFYDGKTVAKAEENLNTNSQDFTTNWTQSRLSVTANATTAPDGTATAEEIVEDSSASITHRIYQTDKTLSAGNYVISVFAKANTRDQIFVRLLTGINDSNGVLFDLTAGTATAVGSGMTGSIVSVGNGWYRCIASQNLASSTTSGAVYFGLAVSGSTSYTGDGTSSLYLWGAQLEQRSSVTAYTPTTTAPITNYIPALQTAGNNVPRFEHNPVTGESLGLEIEGQRTNLLTYSDDFANAIWSKTSNSSISSNVAIAPDGTLTADRFITNSGISLGSTLVQQTVTAAAGTYTLTGYVKAGGYNRCVFNFRDNATSANTATATFSFVDGSVVSTATTGTFTGVSATITAVGNGWYRASLTATTTGATAFQNRIWNQDSVITTGDSFSGLLVWGAQLEAGSFATSYIPTVASQVTRSVDSARMTGANFSSWYRADEGTLYGEASTNNLTSTAILWNLSSGNFSSNSILRYSNYGSASGTTLVFGYSKSTLDIDMRISSTAVLGVNNKSATSIKLNDYAYVVDGGTVSTDTNAGVPVVNQLQIGSGVNVSFSQNGTIKKLAYYPRRLTNAEIQSLTTI